MLIDLKSITTLLNLGYIFTIDMWWKNTAFGIIVVSQFSKCINAKTQQLCAFKNQQDSSNKTKQKSHTRNISSTLYNNAG